MSILNDLRHARRLFLQSPGFTLTALAALAIGIGANTAIFSVVNTVLLKPVPAPDPDRVVVFRSIGPDGRAIGGSETRFNVWRQQDKLFQDVCAYRYGVENLTGVDAPEQIRLGQVSKDYFSLFGLSPARGRTFQAAEDRPGAGHFAVLSDAFWKRAFAGDPALIGKTISLSGTPHLVLGILAPNAETESPLPIDVRTPFQIDPASTNQSHYFKVAGRVRAGVTRGMIRAQLRVVADDFRHQFPNVSTMLPGSTFDVIPMRDAIGVNVRASLLTLAGAVGLVLLIACANVANLLMVRSTGRKREIAIRAAVGATRSRLMRQLLTESVLLSIAGGAIGLVAGIIGIRALLVLNPGNIPRIGPNGSAVTPDWRVLSFTIAVSLLTGIVFGLLPALQSSRADLGATLKEGGGRFGTGLRQNKARSILVIAEVALALILLIGSGLLIRAFVAMRSVNPGFDTHNVLTMQMSLTGDRFQKTAGLVQVVQSSLDRLHALPGVEAVTASCCLPIGSVPNAPFTILGRPLTGSFHARANYRAVSLEYFDVFKIPIQRGRAFNENDTAQAPHVLIINQATARRFWPNADPLGAQLNSGTIIGIAGDIHERTDRSSEYPLEAEIYLPLAQSSDASTAYVVRLPFTWMVRTRVELHSLGAAVKTELQQASGDLPVTGLRTMDEIVAKSTASQDFNTLLMLVFGGCAVILAAIGIYGLLSYSVQQRSQEIGIRLALGAGSSEVRNMIVAHGMWLALIGVAAGTAVSLGLTRVLASLLLDVPARDPLVFLVAPVLLMGVALLAVWLPAVRASRVDAIQALRYE